MKTKNFKIKLQETIKQKGITNVKSMQLEVPEERFLISLHPILATVNSRKIDSFLKEYEKLISFWNNKLPNQIYNCEYENLINNQLDETKKIISFCNLDWQDNCIDHTKNDTGIKTVSISQARKPIYKSSIKLSDNYLKYLNFLKKI